MQEALPVALHVAHSQVMPDEVSAALRNPPPDVGALVAEESQQPFDVGLARGGVDLLPKVSLSNSTL